MGYSEVSAKKGDGIEVLFQSIIDNILIIKSEEEIEAIKS